MTSPTQVLAERFATALGAAFGPEYAEVDPVIRPSQFADFQANAALALAKRLGAKPRDVAQQLLEHLEIDDVCEPPEVSGPGFVNLTLRREWVAEQVAAGLGCGAGEVIVCSTGLIGLANPRENLLCGVQGCLDALAEDGGPAAAEAILTTDSVTKQVVVERAGWSIGGMAKGAGMLAPQLATMLVVLTTDAAVPAADLDAALRAATAASFDRLDSDGCMSTNDTVIAMASGASGVTPTAGEFTAALTDLCQDLARQLIADAEGAGHEIAIEVTGAASERDAEVVGREIARSNLFKCAVFGNDPNWGRVLSAIGVTDAVFEPDQLDVSFNGVMVCRGGQIGEDRSLVDLAPRNVHVLVDLHSGTESATILTNDLTYDYVRENAEYSS